MLIASRCMHPGFSSGVLSLVMETSSVHHKAGEGTGKSLSVGAVLSLPLQMRWLSMGVPYTSPPGSSSCPQWQSVCNAPCTLFIPCLVFLSTLLLTFPGSTPQINYWHSYSNAIITEDFSVLDIKELFGLYNCTFYNCSFSLKAIFRASPDFSWKRFNIPQIYWIITWLPRQIYWIIYVP